MLTIIVLLIAFAVATAMLAKFYSTMDSVEAKLKDHLDEFSNEYKPELKKMHTTVFEHFDATFGSCLYRHTQFLNSITEEMESLKSALVEIHHIVNQRGELEQELQKCKAILARMERRNEKNSTKK